MYHQTYSSSWYHSTYKKRHGSAICGSISISRMGGSQPKQVENLVVSTHLYVCLDNQQNHMPEELDK